MLLELLATQASMLFVVGGGEKLLRPDPFARWSHSAGLPVRVWGTRALATVEVVIGVLVLQPVGRALAAVFLLIVTPIGAVMVRRTGACACRGVVKAQSGRALVLRNSGLAGALLLLSLSSGSVGTGPAALGSGAYVLLFEIASRVRCVTGRSPSELRGLRFS